MSAPYYLPSNTSFLQPKYTLNDLSVSGVYNGTADTTYSVIISSVNKADNCTVESLLPHCFEVNDFQWYVLESFLFSIVVFLKDMNIISHIFCVLLLGVLM